MTDQAGLEPDIEGKMTMSFIPATVRLCVDRRLLDDRQRSFVDVANTLGLMRP
jgi:hypothetical protein